jgi:hypothetical protein
MKHDHETRSLGNAERRNRLIREQPAVVGAGWARDSCREALQCGRRIEGGWPGTVPEARMRVLHGLTRELAAQGLAPLSHEELVAATATAYERAKRDWQLAGKLGSGYARNGG